MQDSIKTNKKTKDSVIRKLPQPVKKQVKPAITERSESSKTFGTFLKLIALFIFMLLLSIAFTRIMSGSEKTDKDKEKTEQSENSGDKWKDKKKSGKNERHKSKSHKSKIAKQYKICKDEIKKLRQKLNKTNAEAKQLRKLEIKAERLFKEMNRKGETHWKKGM